MNGVDIGEGELETFLLKSGDDEICEAEYAESDEHGFMTYNLLPDLGLMVIVQCYGDGVYWNDRATEIAQSHGFKSIKFATKRSPKGFERKFGYRVVGVILEREV